MSYQLIYVLYKLLSKDHVNRTKLLLPSLISNCQSTLILERQISDNILVAYEIVLFLKRRKRGKQWSTSIKLDISKVYDRIEWGYLEHTSVALNFLSHFIALIMVCAKSATFSIMINP